MFPPAVDSLPIIPFSIRAFHFLNTCFFNPRISFPTEYSQFNRTFPFSICFLRCNTESDACLWKKRRSPTCFFQKWVYSIRQFFCGAVAQLARAIRSHRIGRGFNSHLLHHRLSARPLGRVFFALFILLLNPLCSRGLRKQSRDCTNCICPLIYAPKSPKTARFFLRFLRFSR